MIAFDKLYHAQGHAMQQDDDGKIEWSLIAILISAILILGYCGLVAVGVDACDLLRYIYENF